jgi:hypothetical protein
VAGNNIFGLPVGFPCLKKNFEYTYHCTFVEDIEWSDAVVLLESEEREWSF